MLTLQTYIDCVHVKKADKGRMQAEDPAEINKEGDTFTGFHEENASDAANEARVRGILYLTLVVSGPIVLPIIQDLLM